MKGKLRNAILGTISSFYLLYGNNNKIKDPLTVSVNRDYDYGQYDAFASFPADEEGTWPDAAGDITDVCYRIFYRRFF